MKLEVKNLTKKYYGDVIALNNVNVTFSSGVNGLIGVNGAGKTTLIKILTATMHANSGCIEYSGRNISEDEYVYKRKLGYLPQQFLGYSDITAEDFMIYMGTLKDMNKKDIKLESDELLELVSLKDVRKKKIGTFSGGMKRRLGIAQALLNKPEILILDEPTVGLDPKERVKFRNLIARIASERVIIISTHIISDVDSIANQIVLMKKGQIVMSGEKQDILASFQGKVWGGTVTQQEADVLSMNHTAVNYVRLQDDRIMVRMIADEKPYTSATILEPNLDDIFLTYLQEG